jgi:hypothetical protein
MTTNDILRQALRLPTWQEIWSQNGAFIALFVLIVIGLVLLWYALGMFWSSPVFPLDDAYITLQNALVLIGKRPEVFVGATPFSGATSFAHTLMTAGLALVMSPEQAMSIVALIGTVLYAAALMAIGYRAGLGPVTSTAITLLGLASGHTLFHVSSGLETPWALAAIAWCLYLLMQPERHKCSLPFMLATMPFIRPELMLLSLIGAGYLFYAFRTAPRSILLQRFLLLFGFLLVWVVIALLSGFPLIPNTVSSKKYFIANGCKPIQVSTDLVLTSIGAWILGNPAIVAGVAGMVRGSLGRLMLIFVVVFICVYWINLPGGLKYHFERYMAPFVPLMCFGLAMLISPTQGIRVHKYLRTSIVIAACMFLILVSAPQAVNKAVSSRYFTIAELMPLANWLKSEGDTNAAIMLHDAGYLGYKLENPLIDLVGLKSSEAAILHREYTWASCGGLRTSVIATLVNMYRPGKLVVLDSWDRAIGISDAAGHVAKLDRVWGNGNGYSVYEMSYPGKR